MSKTRRLFATTAGVGFGAVDRAFHERGLTFSPAKVGETIVIYGIGFGPVTPSTPAGVIATQANSLQTQPTFRFGQTPATLIYSGLAPNFAGLYQFNVAVPDVGAGDMPLNIDVGGVPLNQNTYITVTQ